MAEKKQDEAQADPNATTGGDSALAEAAGLSEGDIKALRDDAGLNQGAGHGGSVGAWEASPAGQEYLKGEKDRQKKAQEEAKAYDEQTDKNGLTEAEAKYQEAVDKARKG